MVKVLLPRLAGHEDVRRAFRERIIKAATLSHSHLARVFDGGQESGSIFMICEYLSGGSLEDVLASGRTLSVDDGARLGRDVGSALAYVHENDMVHGSLSPSKLLLDEEGRVRVSDIALAGIGREYRERVTLDDVRFLSPEQAIGDPANPRSDVYALALILYEAVTGITPFDGVTPEAVLRARINATLPMRPELGSLDMVLAQATVSDPRVRLDAETFASRLGAVVSDFAPLVIPPIGGEVPLLSQYRPSEPRNSVGFRPPSPDQITGATAVVSSIGRTGRAAPRPSRRRVDDDGLATGPRSKRSRKSRRPGLRRSPGLSTIGVLSGGGGPAHRCDRWGYRLEGGALHAGELSAELRRCQLGGVPEPERLRQRGVHQPSQHREDRRFRRRDRTRVLLERAERHDHLATPVFNTEAKSGQIITVTVSDGIQTRATSDAHRADVSRGRTALDQTAPQGDVSGQSDDREFDGRRRSHRARGQRRRHGDHDGAGALDRGP